MIGYRPADEHDRRFIVSGWSASYRTAHAAGLLLMDEYADVMHRQITRILDRPSTIALVAYETDEPDRIADLYGFVVADVLTDRAMPMVYYVYTKEAYRRDGIARGLLHAAGVNLTRPFEYACKTSVTAKLRSSMPLARFNPIRARYEPDTGDKSNGKRHAARWS